MQAASTFWKVWRIPMLLAALTLFGLLAALLETGAWHWAAWAALLAPIATAAYFIWGRKTRSFP